MGKRKRSKGGKAPEEASPDAKASTKRVKTDSSNQKTQTTKLKNAGNAADVPHKTEAPKRSPPTAANPLLSLQAKFLNESVTPVERDNFFSEELISPDRRAQIWAEQADIGETLVNTYAWATPDDRALRIIRHFAPIVEIGCGSNAYWCNLMRQKGIDVLGFDKSPDSGGKIHSDEPSTSNIAKDDAFGVRSGGPEVLANHSDRTLFLCYPDEEVLDNADEKEKTQQSMAEACLEHYKGDCIIHVGELFLDPTFSMEQAPWGRSSSSAFQERLAAEYHCILRATLPNWLHTADRMTVWKRSPTIVIAYDDENEDHQKNSEGGSESSQDGTEEVAYRHIPKEERLPVDIAAPCVAHLLTDTVTIDPSQPEVTVLPPSPKQKKKKSSKRKTKSPPLPTEEPYSCPW